MFLQIFRRESGSVDKTPSPSGRRLFSQLSKIINITKNRYWSQRLAASHYVAASRCRINKCSNSTCKAHSTSLKPNWSKVVLKKIYRYWSQRHAALICCRFPLPKGSLFRLYMRHSFYFSLSFGEGRGEVTLALPKITSHS